jgi:hypothetical protein
MMSAQAFHYFPMSVGIGAPHRWLKHTVREDPGNTDEFLLSIFRLYGASHGELRVSRFPAAVSALQVLSLSRTSLPCACEETQEQKTQEGWRGHADR